MILTGTLYDFSHVERATERASSGYANTHLCPRSDKVVGPFFARRPQRHLVRNAEESMMNSVIYIVGLVVVVIAVLSFFGLR
jgi:hypothetical protein